MADIRASIGLPPTDTLEAFRSKGVYPVTADWDRVWQEENARAFYVTKMLDRTLAERVRASLDDVIAKGGTFEQWKQTIVPQLQAAGWYGRIDGRPELTGVDYPIFVGEGRLRTIYDTNLRMARAAGKWKRIQALKSVAPYLRYSAILDSRTRPDHRLWHGTILPVDHPWWDTHFPPCGWRCRCTVVQLSDRDLKARGWKVTETPPDSSLRPWRKSDGTVVQVPQGIDPGFAYNPGKAHLRGLAPGPIDGGLRFPIIGPDRKASDETPAERTARLDRLAELPPMPQPREVSSDLLLSRDTPPEDAIQRFLDHFGQRGITDGVVRLIEDVAGEPLVISDSFFFRGGVAGQGPLKLDDKGFRTEHLLLLAETLISPDEIWWAWEYFDALGRWQMRRRYLARFLVDGQTRAMILSMNTGAAGWEGVSAFASKRGTNYLTNQRGGVLAWRRPE
ncbi:hypothetical protein GVO57_07295 [Sphingomonas changnyeongensis]|uniref:Phage head morphogenesis domain-containing protein n=1 Tax=Sphingomonas changnyeongensis TaxID=2698679 RepID=A0A7Z2S8I6_9SPHN|nr:PBECR2 nuclease fold domain-containing protein [Sphingomonas changnyeongensis]QHL90672.1 hypothetical protein GVO57_07295 [Sphingomonas changnyeongensis]